jgi:hypothetical protein
MAQKLPVQREAGPINLNRVYDRSSNILSKSRSKQIFLVVSVQEGAGELDPPLDAGISSSAKSVVALGLCKRSHGPSKRSARFPRQICDSRTSRRANRGTCTKSHGAPIRTTPPMRACSPLDDRYAKCVFARRIRHSCYTSNLLYTLSRSGKCTSIPWFSCSRECPL